MRATKLILAKTRALYEFNARYHRAPRPASLADAEAIASLAAALHAGPQNAESLRRIATQAAGNLNPMAALFGGLAAQEALKACSQSLLPIRQFCFFDALEALPELPLAESGAYFD